MNTRFQRWMLNIGGAAILFAFGGFVLEVVVFGQRTPLMIVQALILVLMGAYFFIETWRERAGKGRR